MKALYPQQETMDVSAVRGHALVMLAGAALAAVLATWALGTYTTRAQAALSGAMQPAQDAPRVVALAPQVQPVRVYRLETVVIRATPAQVAEAQAETALQAVARAAGDRSGATTTVVIQ